MTQTKVNLTSQIFSPAFRQALSAVPNKMAREFKQSTKDKMIRQSPQGKVYEKKKSGKGFKRFHKASAKGQRPQPDTLTLVNALSSQRTGEFSALVDVKNRINPENQEDARDYAEILENKLARQIMGKDDVRVAQLYQDYEVEKVVSKFL
jgi:hypothetical protein